MARDRHEYLTPAQKAKHTRLYNRLNEERVNASAMHYEIYREKIDAIREANQEREQTLREAYDIKQQELKRQIEQLREEIDKNRKEYYDATTDIHREESAQCKPEYEAWQEVSDLAHKRFKEKWELANEAFFIEQGLGQQTIIEQEMSA